MNKLKQRIWELLEDAKPDDPWSLFFDYFLITLVFLNVLAVVIESVDSIHLRYAYLFELFETFSVVIFSVEYLLRLWTCVVCEQYRSFFYGRIKFAISPLALADFIAVVPFFLPFLGLDLRSMRALRLLRLLRILKVGRYSGSLRLFSTVFQEKRVELTLSFFIAGLMLMIASTLMYYAEHSVQPEKFPDIPTTMWWAMMTLTTIGYGDVVPVTGVGRLIASFVAILGLGCVALPTSIIATAFFEQVQKRSSHSYANCPHCGESLEDQ